MALKSSEYDTLKTEADKADSNTRQPYDDLENQYIELLEKRTEKEIPQLDGMKM